MTEQRVVATLPDGRMMVLIPSPRRVRELMSSGMTEDEAVDAIASFALPAGHTNPFKTTRAQIPADREFRNAWEQAGGIISTNLAKARDIQANRIEAARIKAARGMLEREALGENITAEKANLRAIDARATVDAAQNIAALKQAWPATLPRP